MDKKYFANVSWSEKLGHLFQDADYRFIWDAIAQEYMLQSENYFTFVTTFPAIHTDMVLEKLPKQHIRIEYHTDNKFGGWGVTYENFDYSSIENFSCKCEVVCDDSLPNALCEMLEWVEKEGGK